MHSTLIFCVEFKLFDRNFQCYNEYGDIIKTTMGKAREINKINCALTMVLSLVSTYKDMQTSNDSVSVSKSSQSFADLKVVIICDHNIIDKN